MRVITVAPALRQYCSASTVSGVSPERDGITTIDRSESNPEPAVTSSAACSTLVGKFDRVVISAAAGHIRIPAPPEATNSRLSLPRSTRSSITPWSSSAHATAPRWFSRNLASSKFNILVSFSCWCFIVLVSRSYR